MSDYSNSLDSNLLKHENKDENKDKNKDENKDENKDIVTIPKNIYKVVSIPIKYENGEKVCVFNTVPLENNKI